MTTHRGIRVVIKRSKTGNPFEICWFIDGQVAESIPFNCDEQKSKRIGTELVDQRIPVDEEWQQAEKKDRESDLSSPIIWMEAELQISFPSGNWVITRRGIRIVITSNDIGEPSEVAWHIGGHPITTAFDENLEAAKHLAIDIVNHRIETEERWREAEREDRQRAATTS